MITPFYLERAGFSIGFNHVDSTATVEYTPTGSTHKVTTTFSTVKLRETADHVKSIEESLLAMKPNWAWKECITTTRNVWDVLPYRVNEGIYDALVSTLHSALEEEETIRADPEQSRIVIEEVETDVLRAWWKLICHIFRHQDNLDCLVKNVLENTTSEDSVFDLLLMSYTSMVRIQNMSARPVYCPYTRELLPSWTALANAVESCDQVASIGEDSRPVATLIKAIPTISRTWELARTDTIDQLWQEFLTKRHGMKKSGSDASSDPDFETFKSTVCNLMRVMTFDREGMCIC